MIVTLYDSIFLIQHYILYSKRRQKSSPVDEERSHLITHSYSGFDTEDDSIVDEDEEEDDVSSYYVNNKYNYGSTTAT